MVGLSYKFYNITKRGEPLAFQYVFKRYEFKYLITKEQKEKLHTLMQEYMQPDAYGKTVIRNLYYDTPTYLLIRRSIDKPFYKEKLRVRSYAKAAPDSTVFIELKKKYDSVVYKRRISMSESDTSLWLTERKPPVSDSQIKREISYFLNCYGELAPAVFLSYSREAFFSRDASGLRITFDDSILCRCEDLSLRSEVYGTELLPPGKVLMEIKCIGGMPLWLTGFLSSEKIYKTSFSKYGTAYREIIFPRLKGEINEYCKNF